jgi:hypothetical protein
VHLPRTKKLVKNISKDALIPFQTARNVSYLLLSSLDWSHKLELRQHWHLCRIFINCFSSYVLVTDLTPNTFYSTGMYFHWSFGRAIARCSCFTVFVLYQWDKNFCYVTYTTVFPCHGLDSPVIWANSLPPPLVGWLRDYYSCFNA